MTYFDIVAFPFLGGNVSRRPSYGVYISQLIRFARMCSHVDDFNALYVLLINFSIRVSRYHMLRRAFSKFYRRHNELVSKFEVRLKYLLHHDLSEPEFYGDLVYNFKKAVGRTDFSDRSKKNNTLKTDWLGYNLNVTGRSACLE